MKVALDATPLTVATGGIARYTRDLSNALAQEYPSDCFYLLSDQTFPSPESPFPNLLAPSYPGPVPRRWWSAGLPSALRRLGVHLFHGTDFSVPYRWRPPSVITIHDLSPWIEGPWHRSSRIAARTPWILRLGLARTVITPSAAVRRQVIDYFGLAPSRVFSVALAASSVFRPVPHQNEASAYLLVVGTLEPRKNVPAVIDAWRAIRDEFPVQLKLVGRMRQDGPAIPSDPGLEYLGIVEDSNLARLYSNSLAVLMPSLYEGFGLPVLEAMQCGAPVLVSADPALREVSGGAAMHVDGDWPAALRTVLSDRELRTRLSGQSLRRARDFSWASTARETHAVYEETLRRTHA